MPKYLTNLRSLCYNLKEKHTKEDSGIWESGIVQS